MANLYKAAKAHLSYYLGCNPVIEKSRKDFRKFIPEPYNGVVIVSADFELAWAWRFDKLSPDPVKNGLILAKRERENIPKIIAYSEKFNIPITWGTVGHLFLEECKGHGGIPHKDLARLSFFENEWWKYYHGDWFEDDPCSSVLSDPEWYAPDLIKHILASKTRHEIGCHSFSHISCSDTTCAPDVLLSELHASQLAADNFGIKLESFIFPGHTMGNFDTLREAQYTSMRTNYINVLGYPEFRSNGLWEHKSTMELRYNNVFSVKTNIRRYQSLIKKCIKNHQVCNFWFHPSFCNVSMNKILPAVYSILDLNRESIWITTMKEYTNWLILNYDTSVINHLEVKNY